MELQGREKQTKRSRKVVEDGVRPVKDLQSQHQHLKSGPNHGISRAQMTCSGGRRAKEEEEGEKYRLVTQVFLHI